MASCPASRCRPRSTTASGSVQMRRGMAVGKLRCAGHEHDVLPVGAKLHDSIAGGSLGNLDFDTGMVVAILADQLRKEVAGDKGMNTDAQPTALPRCSHSGGFSPAWSR